MTVPMKGCLDNTEIVHCELPPEEIVKRHIDPWSIDLLDPRPVRMRLHGESVCFSRLNSTVFGYVLRGRVHLGILRGSTRLCVTGDQPQATNDSLTLTNVRTSEFEFDRLLHMYLRRFCTENAGDFQPIEASGLTCKLRYIFDTDRIAIRGGTITVRQAKHHMAFRGQMFKPILVKTLKNKEGAER
jgi:hypothetical protein